MKDCNKYKKTDCLTKKNCSWEKNECKMKIRVKTKIKIVQTFF